MCAQVQGLTEKDRLISRSKLSGIGSRGLPKALLVIDYSSDPHQIYWTRIAFDW